MNGAIIAFCGLMLRPTSTHESTNRVPTVAGVINSTLYITKVAQSNVLGYEGSLGKEGKTDRPIRLRVVRNMNINIIIIIIIYI